MKKLKGFTLIELLIVIAIIGILAGVLFSAFTSTQQRAKDTKALQIVKNMQTAAASCRLGEGTVQLWSDRVTGGGNVCSVTGIDTTTWASLANTNWQWYPKDFNGSATNDFVFYAEAVRSDRTPANAIEVKCTVSGCSKIGF